MKGKFVKGLALVGILAMFMGTTHLHWILKVVPGIMDLKIFI